MSRYPSTPEPARTRVRPPVRTCHFEVVIRWATGDVFPSPHGDVPMYTEELRGSFDREQDAEAEAHRVAGRIRVLLAEDPDAPLKGDAIGVAINTVWTETTI